MNGEPYSSVREAMRLMQAGDLLAATAAIQHRLSGATAAEPSTAARSPDRSPIEGTFRVVDEIPLAKDATAGGSPARAPAPEERTQFSEHTYTVSAVTRPHQPFIPRPIPR